MQPKTLGVLFDLDGMLIDFAPGLVCAVNVMRFRRAWLHKQNIAFE